MVNGSPTIEFSFAWMDCWLMLSVSTALDTLFLRPLPFACCYYLCPIPPCLCLGRSPRPSSLDLDALSLDVAVVQLLSTVQLFEIHGLQYAGLPTLHLRKFARTQITLSRWCYQTLCSSCHPWPIFRLMKSNWCLHHTQDHVSSFCHSGINAPREQLLFSSL